MKGFSPQALQPMCPLLYFNPSLTTEVAAKKGFHNTLPVKAGGLFLGEPNSVW